MPEERSKKADEVLLISVLLDSVTGVIQRTPIRHAHHARGNDPVHWYRLKFQKLKGIYLAGDESLRPFKTYLESPFRVPTQPDPFIRPHRSSWD